jgi:hypothetical protein
MDMFNTVQLTLTAVLVRTAGNTPNLAGRGGKMVQGARGHRAPVTAVDIKFASHRLYLITGSMDHTVSIWVSEREDRGPVRPPASRHAAVGASSQLCGSVGGSNEACMRVRSYRLRSLLIPLQRSVFISMWS